MTAILALLPLLMAQVSKTDPKPGEEREVEIAKGVKMKFCWIPSGSATLGSPADEMGREEYGLKLKETEHEYTSKGFWMGKYAVTQEEWESLMGENPSYFVRTHNDIKEAGIRDTSRFPVERVSWVDCQDFLKALNKVEGVEKVLGKGSFKLPHEDQWEYACRGGKGNANPFYWGKSLNGDKANCDGNIPYGTTDKGDYLRRTSEVGEYETRAPHPWGLCDMSGNVWQWCANRLTGNGTSRVLRGGSWKYDAVYCRVASRYGEAPLLRSRNFGFRVVLD